MVRIRNCTHHTVVRIVSYTYHIVVRTISYPHSHIVDGCACALDGGKIREGGRDKAILGVGGFGNMRMGSDKYVFFFSDKYIST